MNANGDLVIIGHYENSFSDFEFNPDWYSLVSLGMRNKGYITSSLQFHKSCINGIDGKVFVFNGGALDSYMYSIYGNKLYADKDLPAPYEITTKNNDYLAYFHDDKREGWFIGRPISTRVPQGIIPQVQIAKPNSSTVFINGKKVALESYTIEGNNYFKLRDLAMLLNGTQKSFEVTWDGARNSINLITGKAYTSVGGELAISERFQEKEAKPTASSVYVDGRKMNLTAYSIGGNNYFKLRDMGKVLNFGVEWDGKTNSIIINTASNYID